MGDVVHGCADRGLTEITEQSVKNLESGRKASMTIADSVVLADVLGVPLVTFLFPLGTSEEVSAWDALAWFTGETPIDNRFLRGRRTTKSPAGGAPLPALLAERSAEG